MIIIGYPGIGKTTLCKHWHKYVDLDSSAFRYNDGTRDKRWAEIYCKVAIDLHNQGYVVFLSSHYEVRDILKKTTFSPDVSVTTITFTSLSLVEYSALTLYPSISVFK
jgi:MoxR-like ATPase